MTKTPESANPDARPLSILDIEPSILHMESVSSLLMTLGERQGGVDAVALYSIANVMQEQTAVLRGQFQALVDGTAKAESRLSKLESMTEAVVAARKKGRYVDPDRLDYVAAEIKSLLEAGDDALNAIIYTPEMLKYTMDSVTRAGHMLHMAIDKVDVLIGMGDEPGEKS